MGKVTFHMTMSLDGFVAGPNDGPENGLGDGGDALFEWYFNGEIEIPTPSTPCFIVTHTVPQEWAGEGSPFVFVTGGVESAIRQAKQAAGD